MTIEKAYKGDLAGSGNGQMLTWRDESSGGASYIAVEGVEGTLHGLDHARARSPDCDFVLADARDCDLGDVSPFDIVYSFYDTLNHILNVDGLLSVFRCVRRVLRPAGIVIFDLDTEQAFRGRWRDTVSIDEDDLVFVGEGQHDPETRLGDDRSPLRRAVKGEMSGRGADRESMANPSYDDAIDRDRGEERMTFTRRWGQPTALHRILGGAVGGVLGGLLTVGLLFAGVGHWAVAVPIG